MANSVAEKARKTAEKYSGAGQSFQVKYLGTQEVSSAKGDAVIADCLKELRTLFKDVVTYLPKVVITLQMSGITVVDDKSKLETIKVPLEAVSYVCLDPADDSVFSFIVRSQDTISSKGLRLHAFVSHPQTAIAFNRSARELFDFMARMMRAKKRLAQQEAQAAMKQTSDTHVKQSVTPQEHPATIPVIAPPPPVSRAQPQPLVQEPDGDTTAGVVDEEKRQNPVFDEWKELERELDDIGKDLGIGTAIEEPITSTPTSSPCVTSAVDPSTLSVKPFPEAASQVQPLQLDVMTASGSDPFGNSFFDLSFGGPQPPVASDPSATTVSSDRSVDSHLFDNPLFSGHSDKTELTSEPEMSTALPSTSENRKQVMYASRPRPKGKALDVAMPISPPPIPDTTDTTSSRNVRDISLSPTGEQEVKSILANTDPFSPPTLNAFQFPLSNTNGPGVFQSTPFDTPNSSVFSPQSISAQDSIQLMNPLYQSYSPNRSFSAPFSPPFQQLQQPAMVMMSPPVLSAVQSPPMVQQMQSVPAMGQSQVQPMPFMGTNSFDGVLSPTIINAPPQTGGASWSAQPPSLTTGLDEQRDTMFADLLLSSSNPIPVKKREFEPQTKKITQPTLAQLQENKKREGEAAFRASTEKTPEEVTDWPLSPFDDVPPTTSLPEPLPGDSPTPPSAPLPAGDQQVPIKQQETAAVAQILPPDDFDVAFQAADSKGENIESAFEVKVTAKPQPLSQPTTNDPFLPNGNIPSPEPEKSAPWSTF